MSNYTDNIVVAILRGFLGFFFSSQSVQCIHNPCTTLQSGSISFITRTSKSCAVSNLIRLEAAQLLDELKSDQFR